METIRPIRSRFGLDRLAALACVVLRFRSSAGIERQQLRWVVAGAAGAVAGLLVGMSGVVVTYFAVLCVPVGVAVAVLRYPAARLGRPGRPPHRAAGGGPQAVQPTTASLWQRARPANAEMLYQART